MSDIVTKMCWENRQHPNVVALFQKILKEEHIWVSFDRYGMMRPTKGISFKNNTNDQIIEDRPQWKSKANW